MHFLLFGTIGANAQMPFPIGGGGAGMNEAPLMFMPQKLLIEKDSLTGKETSIGQGDFVKLKFLRTKGKPGVKHIESRVLFVTDDALLFIKKKAFPIIPPFLTFSRKPSFDTVKFSSIIALRSYSDGVMGAVRNAAMMPTMSFIPTSINGFPSMLLVGPGTSFIFKWAGNIMYPLHYLQPAKNTPSRFSLTSGIKPVDSVFYIPPPKPLASENDYEWDIEKNNRWEKTNKKAMLKLTDALLNTNLDRNITNISLGSFFIPNYAKGPRDEKTRVDISENQFVFGFSTEHFITNKDRVGIEIQTHMMHQSLNTYGNVQSGSGGVTGGVGMVLSTFSYIKLGMGGIYNEMYRKRLWENLYRAEKDTTDDIDVEISINRLRTKIVAEPKVYFLLGAGAVNTNLIRFQGNITSGSDISTTDYSQKKLALEAGIGLFSRLGKRLTYDMCTKYIWGSGYSHSIGGVNSYSGFKLQFNIGFITNSGFARLRKQLQNMPSNINLSGPPPPPQ
jgi:hypothetical protein